MRQLQRRNINIPVIVYSSSLTDVSKFKNVKKYVLTDCDYITERFTDFIELCKEFKECIEIHHSKTC